MYDWKGIAIKLTDRQARIVPERASFALDCWDWLLGSLVNFTSTLGDERISPPVHHSKLSAGFLQIDRDVTKVRFTRPPIASTQPRDILFYFYPRPAAAARFFISSGATSSTCVAMCHWCPKGSSRLPDRSP